MPEWMQIVDLPPEHPERRIHLERYEYAARVLAGKQVLDCACGMGYGTDLLRKAGCPVVGIDIDPAAIALALERYPSTAYFTGDYYTYPMEGFEALVSFETLEHLDEPERVIDRLPDGMREIVASVPIRPTVGWNPWHRRDFTPDSFRELIRRRFRIVHEMGQLWIDGEDLYLMLHGRR